MYRCSHLSRSPEASKAHGNPTPCTTRSYHPHLSRSPGPPRAQGPIHWVFLCSPGGSLGPLGNPTRHHLFVSPPPVSIPSGP